MEQKEFVELLKHLSHKIILHIKIAHYLNCISNVNDIFEKIHNHIDNLYNHLIKNQIPNNYLMQFGSEAQQLLSLFNFNDFNDVYLLSDDLKYITKQNFEDQLKQYDSIYKQVTFNLDFFSKLNFFQSNIVAIGANGSGKTTLSYKLRNYLPNNGVVISAQKILVIPTFSGISNLNNTSEQLKSLQNTDKSLKVTYAPSTYSNATSALNHIGSEFQILLDNLLAERSAVRNIFCDSLIQGSINTSVPQTKLDKTISIWNSLILHRKLNCEDGINLTLNHLEFQYPAYQMSDGEKVILYLIAQILQAPESGFIIIDEPEMYLHKTILKRLYDTLESERPDCIFLYLTHDLDFASSRTDAKKIWIKSFEHPENWEIEHIPQNEIPETLLLELLGSRKNILFCEGEKGGLDEKIYSVLFPNLTVTPVDNCFAVINHTKAFNKIKKLGLNAVGIIDSDHHGIERLKSLELNNIYSFSMTEIENLYLDEGFLKIVCKILLKEDAVIRIKEDVLAKMEEDIELQVSNFISAKIDYYFKDSHISKGNNLIEIKNNFKAFHEKIDIQELYDNREKELHQIIKNKDYQKALSIYNNKGLKKIANNHLKILDFTDRATTILQNEPLTHEHILKHFPQILRTL